MKLSWGPAVVLLRKHEKNWNLAPGEIFAHSCSQHPCSQQQTHNLTISPSPPLTTEKWGSHPQLLFDSFSTIPKPKHQESCFRPRCPIIENKVSGISSLQGAPWNLVQVLHFICAHPFTRTDFPRFYTQGQLRNDLSPAFCPGLPSFQSPSSQAAQTREYVYPFLCTKMKCYFTRLFILSPTEPLQFRWYQTQDRDMPHCLLCPPHR